ncbi:hypothetical protein [Streptomyces sp. NPDC088757]|uniref:hypothetical protein n=1 Tax=Streptomyces sp. NPDC088757 TaxID=3365889 RepID=UPI00382FA600
MSTRIVTDHPGWIETAEGDQARVVEHREGVWLAVRHRRYEHLSLRLLAGDPDAEPPPVAYTSPIALPVAPEGSEALYDGLVRLGTLVRLTNPSLWDALVAALLRRGATEEQARKRYGDFCAAYGRSFGTPVGALALVPSPETVLTLSVPRTFPGTALCAAADACLEHGGRWAALGPEDLLKELAGVPHVGPWAAVVATSDFTGDFSVRPYDGRAVRTGATEALPGREPEALWQGWTPTRGRLHALHLFTVVHGDDTGPGP